MIQKTPLVAYVFYFVLIWTCFWLNVNRCTCFWHLPNRISKRSLYLAAEWYHFVRKQGDSRLTVLCWVGNNINMIMKPLRTPQPRANPTQEKNRLKVAFGPLLPTAKSIFRGVGIDFISEKKTDYRKPNPIKFAANTPLLVEQKLAGLYGLAQASAISKGPQLFLARRKREASHSREIKQNPPAARPCQAPASTRCCTLYVFVDHDGTHATNHCQAGAKRSLVEKVKQCCTSTPYTCRKASLPLSIQFTSQNKKKPPGATGKDMPQARAQHSSQHLQQGPSHHYSISKPNKQGVRGEVGWVTFPVVCFLYKTNPNPRKNTCCGKKSGPNATF